MPAEIIEIIGPPGIGKTTVYNALCKKWNLSCNWIYQNALLTPEPAFGNFYFWIQFRIKKLLNKEISKSIPIEFGLRFAKSHTELANFCWKFLSNANVYPDENAALRFRSVFLLYLDFCRYQAIVEKKSILPCVLNEGLLQKSFLLCADLRLMSDSIKQYLALTPLPKAIIYINTEDKELIAQRLLNRSKVIASQVGKNKIDLLEDIGKWQLQHSLIISWMIDHHVRVYNIDGARSIDENVLCIARILDQQRSLSPGPDRRESINIVEYEKLCKCESGSLTCKQQNLAQSF